MNTGITASLFPQEFHATSKGVRLHSSLASISALWVISNCATSVLLLEAAANRGVSF